MTRFDKIGLHALAVGDWHGTSARTGVARPLVAASAAQRAAVLGGLGLGSAVLSDLYGGWWGSLPYPALPGLFFGLVLVAGVTLWGTRRPLALVGVFAATNLAWWGAFQTSARLYTAVQDLSAVPGVWCGVLSGAIGAFVTLCGVALAGPGCNTRGTWARTLAIGGLAGILLQSSELPLFLVWQAGVAASIGWSLSPAPRSR